MWRKCRQLPNTLALVIKQNTKPQRLARYNGILKQDEKRILEVDKAAILLQETSLIDGEVILKPDLVVKTKKKVFLVDVTVRHEDGNYL